MVIDDFWRPFIRHTPIPFLLDLAPAGAALLQAGGLHHLTARRVLRAAARLRPRIGRPRNRE